jgi:predicted secreted protein
MRRLLLVPALVAVGCTGRPPAVQTLTELDEGTRATVRVGDVVEIELRTPTSGLGAWRALDPPGAILRREPGPDYDRDPAAAGIARAAGVSTWRYSADAPGSATLRFEFVGTGVPETREFPVTVAPRPARR